MGIRILHMSMLHIYSRDSSQVNETTAKGVNDGISKGSK